MDEKNLKSSTDAFEQALIQNNRVEYCLRLYIAGTTLKSIRAIETIKSICEDYLPQRYTLDIIDIYQQPELAQQAQIFATPTLIKTLPLPLQRIIGDMSKTEKIIVGLDIVPKNYPTI
ncbi:MAG: circadian clock KaiB family protein [Coleofasciculus sp. G3-WIS-01]|uniref:circadian clock KaiB family protein n=1 Tax=Coleofasciculus sp. G3-WIS-01 TaxID=3069528 RepID=UPI0032F2DC80